MQHTPQISPLLTLGLLWWIFKPKKQEVEYTVPKAQEEKKLIVLSGKVIYTPIVK